MNLPNNKITDTINDLRCLSGIVKDPEYVKMLKETADMLEHSKSFFITETNNKLVCTCPICHWNGTTSLPSNEKR